MEKVSKLKKPEVLLVNIGSNTTGGKVVRVQNVSYWFTKGTSDTIPGDASVCVDRGEGGAEQEDRQDVETHRMGRDKEGGEGRMRILLSGRSVIKNI